jgi:nucleoside phosphorylase
MKIVYRYNSQNVFVSNDVVADDYQLQAGETFVAIPQWGLMPIKWTGSAWQQATTEEHAAYVQQQQAAYLAQHPGTAKQAGPSDQDKLNATTSVQLDQLVYKSKQQDQLNAQLTIDVATLKQALQKQDTKTTDTTATTATTAQAQA